MVQDFEYFAKMAKFRQILSHCSRVITTGLLWQPIYLDDGTTLFVYYQTMTVQDRPVVKFYKTTYEYRCVI